MLEINRHVARDLFGEPLPPVAARRRDGKFRKIGYADRTGTGPKGQRCATCKFAQKVTQRGEFTHKCELMALVWAHGPASDINLRAPACSKWERKPFTAIPRVT